MEFCDFCRQNRPDTVKGIGRITTVHICRFCAESIVFMFDPPEEKEINSVWEDDLDRLLDVEPLNEIEPKHEPIPEEKPKSNVKRIILYPKGSLQRFSDYIFEFIEWLFWSY
jgi:hypothetical protein